MGICLFTSFPTSQPPLPTRLRDLPSAAGRNNAGYCRLVRGSWHFQPRIAKYEPPLIYTNSCAHIHTNSKKIKILLNPPENLDYNINSNVRNIRSY